MRNRSDARGPLARAAFALAVLCAGAPAWAERPPAEALEAPLAARSTMNALARAGDHAVAVGAHGTIVRIEADGTWYQASSPVDVMLTRVRFLDERHGWAVGHDGAIVHSTDGGEQWELQRWDPDGSALYDIHFFDARRGIAVGGYGTYLVTDDGGQSWREEPHDIVDIGQHFYDLMPLPDGTLLLTGERGLLAFSTDDAQSWELVDSPYTGSLFGALPFGESGAVIYGLRGNIFVTDEVKTLPVMDWMDWDLFERESVTDEDALAALGWRRIVSPVNESFFGSAAEPGGTMLVVGVNGHVVRIDPAAVDAERLQVPEMDTLGDILVDDGGWLLAGRGGIRQLVAGAAGDAQ